MTLEQLRIFVAVAERQHMTQAARALNLAQSAASHAIQMLEARHQTQLFNRIGRRIELTEAGHVLLTEAKTILAQVEAADLALSDFGTLKRGTLSVHASQTIAGYWLPRHLVDFRQRNPNIQIRLEIGNTAQVAAAVENGLAELGFVEGTVDIGQLICTPVARDQLIIVVAPDHPWADHPWTNQPGTLHTPITPDDLMKATWVLREPGSGTRSVFEAALTRLKIDTGSLNIALELPSNEAVRAAVEAGMGATALSASVAAPSIEAGLLHPVNYQLPERNFYLLRHASRYRTHTANVLVDRLGMNK